VEKILKNVKKRKKRKKTWPQ